MHTSLHYLSLSDAARLVERRLVSPVELTRAMLDRIQAHDGRLHAFITVTPEQAFAAARSAEAEIMAGRYRGPLHGIPIAYKDNVETKGIRTTAHSLSMAGHVPDADAEVVARLSNAGAVGLGKLSLQELAYGSPSANDAFPSPVNPWSLVHSPGGSSSGSGVAVAAGFVYGAVGTDTGGSIRHPAAVCGVVGMKPSFGLVSTRGTIALSPTQDHVGPLTRHVRDNAVMLEAMCGAGFRRTGKLAAGTRVGVPSDVIRHVGIDPDVHTAFKASIDLLGALGAVIVEVRTPMFEVVNAIGTRIILVEAWRRYGAALQETPELFGDAFRHRVLQGALVAKSDYEQALAAQAEIQRHYETVFARQADVIVSPGREEPAMPMQALRDNPLGVRGQLTRMYNLARVPALAMPMGFSADGLPLSLQIAAARGQEARLYDIAEELERVSGWTDYHPDLEGQSRSQAGGSRHA